MRTLNAAALNKDRRGRAGRLSMSAESRRLPRRADDPIIAAAGEPAPEDKRLERLYDYTKFHIGIYLSSSAGLAGLISAIAPHPDKVTFLGQFIGSPALLGLSLLFMVLAGACGGVVATTLTEVRAFDDFWSGSTGPSWWPRRGRLSGQAWVAAEHLFFWASLLCALVAVLSHPTTWLWVVQWSAPPIQVPQL